MERVRPTRRYRRYPNNRKLYDLDGAHYTTLTELLEVTKEYDPIVRDTVTGDDATYDTLLNALLHEEKKLPQEKTLNSRLVCEIIRFGGFTKYINYLEEQGKQDHKAQG